MMKIIIFTSEDDDLGHMVDACPDILGLDLFKTSCICFKVEHSKISKENYSIRELSDIDFDLMLFFEPVVSKDEKNKQWEGELKNFGELTTKFVKKNPDIGSKYCVVFHQKANKAFIDVQQNFCRKLFGDSEPTLYGYYSHGGGGGVSFYCQDITGC